VTRIRALFLIEEYPINLAKKQNGVPVRSVQNRCLITGYMNQGDMKPSGNTEAGKFFFYQPSLLTEELILAVDE
jgi:hypothetical protein